MAHRDHELLPDLLQADVAALREGHPQAQRGMPVRALHLVGQLGMQEVGGGVLGEQLTGEAIEHLWSDHLLFEVTGGQHRHRRESLSDEL